MKQNYSWFLATALFFAPTASGADCVPAPLHGQSHPTKPSAPLQSTPVIPHPSAETGQQGIDTARQKDLVLTQDYVNKNILPRLENLKTRYHFSYALSAENNAVIIMTDIPARHAPDAPTADAHVSITVKYGIGYIYSNIDPWIAATGDYRGKDRETVFGATRVFALIKKNAQELAKKPLKRPQAKASSQEPQLVPQE